MATRRIVPFALVGLSVVLLLGIAFRATHDSGAGRSRSTTPPAASVPGPRVEALSPEEKRARELASKGIAAQPLDVQVRYRAATAEANKRVIETRRAALSALRDARAKVAADHSQTERLAAIDDQIRLSEQQLARAESANLAE